MISQNILHDPWGPYDLYGDNFYSAQIKQRVSEKFIQKSFFFRKDHFLRGLFPQSVDPFLLTRGIVEHEELLDSTVASICHKHVSVSVETHALWRAQLIGSRAWSKASHHAPKTIRTGSNNTTVTRIHNEEIPISIKRDSCWIRKCDGPR